MIYYDIVDDKRRAILPYFLLFKNKGFYLAGGTGLALQIGHRDSVDFDFFHHESFNTQSLIQEINSTQQKKVICIELQAEPWNSKLFYDTTVERQEKSMNLNQFKDNIIYAKNTGLNEFYLWGAEWWFWLKETQHKPEIWDEAKKLF